MNGFGYIKDGRINMKSYTMFNLFKKTYELPFKYEIPHYTKQYLDNTPYLKRFLKFTRRYLYILINGQTSLESLTINEKHNNILWINLSAPSLGDSLMDLASRVLLKDKSVDLYTDKKNAHIYLNDQVFNSIIVDDNLIDGNKYDLVIIDSYSTRSLKIKIKHLKKTQFVGMYGYYNGPEVNRVLYSFHQMNHLLNYELNENEINENSKAQMDISRSDEELIINLKLPENYLAITLGGEWNYRTYNNWEKVIEQILLINANTNIVFIGSSNAKDIARILLEKFDNKNIINCVDKYSFCQTAQIIKTADVLLTCDGGLMHAANGVGTTIIPLFARLTPEMQLSKAIRSFPLFDKNNVNNIQYTDIIKNYKMYLETEVNETNS